MLTESGSCFVQISDENVHLVKELMDEIFGPEQFMSLISFRTKIPLNAAIEASVTVNQQDIRRVVRWAEILERATGTPTRAVII